MISTPREAHTLCLAVQSSALSSARCRGASPLPHAGASENIGSISFTPPLVAFPAVSGSCFCRAFLRAHCGVLREGRFPFRPSLLLLGFPPHPEAGFFRVLRGADSMIEQFVCKGTLTPDSAPPERPALVN